MNDFVNVIKFNNEKFLVIVDHVCQCLNGSKYMIVLLYFTTDYTANQRITAA